VTPRALFLGQFSKHAFSSSEFLSSEPSDNASISSHYLGIGFLAYFPRDSSVQQHGVINGSFEVILCDPEKGLIKHSDSDVITLSPDYYTLKTIACGNTAASKKAFEKVYTIAVKTGLIDVTVGLRDSSGAPKDLTRTVVRSIHKGFTEIIRQAP